jgi:hypothetical protein
MNDVIERLDELNDLIVLFDNGDQKTYELIITKYENDLNSLASSFEEDIDKNKLRKKYIELQKEQTIRNMISSHLFKPYWIINDYLQEMDLKQLNKLKIKEQITYNDYHIALNKKIKYLESGISYLKILLDELKESVDNECHIDKTDIQNKSDNLFKILLPCWI